MPLSSLGYGIGVPEARSIPDEPEEYTKRHSMIWGFSSLLLTLDVILVLYRCYSRIRIQRHFLLDDVVILLSLLCAFGVLACIIITSSYGLSQTFPSLEETMRQHRVKLTFVTAIIAVCGGLFVKLSVFLFILRNLKGRTVRTIIKILTGAYMTEVVLSLGFVASHCEPKVAFWGDDMTSTKKCFLNRKIMMTAFSTCLLNSVSSIVMASIPIALTLRKHLNRESRFWLITIAAFGYVAAMTAVFTTIEVSTMRESNAYLTNYFLWINLELYTGIVAASLPTVNPFHKALVAALSPNSNNNNNNNTCPAEQHGRNHDGSLFIMRSLSHRSHPSPCNNSTRHHRINHKHTHSSCERVASVSQSGNYKVEISGCPGSNRDSSSSCAGSQDEIIAAARQGRVPAIIRRTDVYIQSDSAATANADASATAADTTTNSKNNSSSSCTGGGGTISAEKDIADVNYYDYDIYNGPGSSGWKV
ncbi:hypothetical protein AJ80_03630 [Polytolypa hystricis UAMH7299]|uniref:Rhodopsin domain-containing protein n=1 Tax=Polytolypa hystricis (strain UAMH7299) TaxID=1447883 RepID=A0A2B7YHM0_POLH7|nr:hypothetical protein AJ80_03630 [Polytolypa hystricis UAMH7299]